jgi:hypothetical protein
VPSSSFSTRDFFHLSNRPSVSLCLKICFSHHSFFSSSVSQKVEAITSRLVRLYISQIFNRTRVCLCDQLSNPEQIKSNLEIVAIMIRSQIVSGIFLLAVLSSAGLVRRGDPRMYDPASVPARNMLTYG